MHLLNTHIVCATELLFECKLEMFYTSAQHVRGFANVFLLHQFCRALKTYLFGLLRLQHLVTSCL